ncbi:MAG: hypothetical protein Ta2F_17350 [Termitinemataceae bacterium]|nr:MAG: hypothetical protein Ta2F_17350 [Termitinemataceae bacterium]
MEVLDAIAACFKNDYHKVLQNVSLQERPRCKAWLAKKLCEEQSIEHGTCKDALDTLETFLFAEAKNKNRKTVFFVITSLIVITFVISVSNNIQTKMAHNNLKKQYDILEDEYNYLLENWTIKVDSISVGNASKSGNWLTKPGNELIASEMRLFNPVINYTSLINSNAKFDIKIIDSFGTMVKNEKSPDGYTYAKTKWVLTGGMHTHDLDGFGDGASSIYSAGEWIVEVWYNGVCLKSQSITLY